MRIIPTDLVSFSVEENKIEKIKQSKAGDLKKKEEDAIRRLNKIYARPKTKKTTKQASFHCRQPEVHEDADKDVQSLRYEFDDPTLPDIPQEEMDAEHDLNSTINSTVSNSTSRFMSNVTNTLDSRQHTETDNAVDTDDSDDDVYDLPATALKLYDGDWTDGSLTSFLNIYQEESGEDCSNTKKRWIIFSTKLYDQCHINKTPGQCKSKVSCSLSFVCYV